MTNATNNPKEDQSGANSAQQQGGANSGQNQNPGKGAPSRHLEPDSSKAECPNPEETLSDGKGTRNEREDAALVKEVIRSRDA